GVRDDRGVADAIPHYLRRDRLVSALDHVEVHANRTLLVAPREHLRRGHRVHFWPPDLGPVGRRVALELDGDLPQLLLPVGVPPPAEVEPRRLGRDGDVRVRARGRIDAQRMLAERAPEAVAQLVAVTARLVVAEPPVVRGDVTGAALQEDA